VEGGVGDEARAVLEGQLLGFHQGVPEARRVAAHGAQVEGLQDVEHLQRRQALAVGRQLVERALDRARESGVQVVYLLTNTAADYFKRIGFESIQRDQVDSAVQQSQEFSTESCDSSTAMRLMLGLALGQGGAIDDLH